MSGEVEIRRALSRRERRGFLLFPWTIYRGDPLWVPPLLPERMEAVDPRRGVFFERGEAELYTARVRGKIVGTICVAEDRHTNEARGLRDCMFGFFECVNDPEVARELFGFAASWAARRRLEELYGPFNLDYEDSYGVLVNGRDRPPAILCAHTPPYYLGLFERFGFRAARGDNIALEISTDERRLERVARLAVRARGQGVYTVRAADFRRWDEEIDTVHRLMLVALDHLPDWIPWRRDALARMLEPYRRVADPELILFAEREGKTVGFFPGAPNMNEILIRANGLRYPWDYLRLLRARRIRPRCLAVKSILLHPDHWGSPVIVLFIDEMARRARERGYTWADLSLTSDDNPQTPSIAASVGARVYKRYRVFRRRVDIPF